MLCILAAINRPLIVNRDKPLSWLFIFARSRSLSLLLSLSFSLPLSLSLSLPLFLSFSLLLSPSLPFPYKRILSAASHMHRKTFCLFSLLASLACLCDAKLYKMGQPSEKQGQNLPSSKQFPVCVVFCSDSGTCLCCSLRIQTPPALMSP